MKKVLLGCLLYLFTVFIVLPSALTGFTGLKIWLCIAVGIGIIIFDVFLYFLPGEIND